MKDTLMISKLKKGWVLLPFAIAYIIKIGNKNNIFN